jgi:hypothetical protein
VLGQNLYLGVDVANPTKDKPSHGPIVFVLAFAENLIPERAKLVLQFR